jgi:hypothetical protein
MKKWATLWNKRYSPVMKNEVSSETLDKKMKQLCWRWQMKQTDLRRGWSWLEETNTFFRKQRKCTRSAYQRIKRETRSSRQNSCVFVCQLESFFRSFCLLHLSFRTGGWTQWEKNLTEDWACLRKAEQSRRRRISCSWTFMFSSYSLWSLSSNFVQ